MRKKTIHKVAVVMDLEYASSRDILPGISEYVRGRCLWHIKVFAEMEHLNVADLDQQFDGLILNERTAIRFADRITKTDTPVIVLGNPEDFPFKPRDNIVFVHNDNFEIGRFGARHLASLGKFRSYAYIPSSFRSFWDQDRFAGFSQFLSERSLAVQTPGKTPLADFLQALPKPAAVMAAYDVLASEVISICNNLSLDIPRQVSVLGVDNDELLCNLSSPTLSSIMPNLQRNGYLAAQVLDRLFRAKRRKPFSRVICSNFQVAVRESSSPVPISTHIVDRALEFIRANALRNLTADDVIAHLGISKSLAYLRFHEATTDTIASAIMKARLDEVAKRLRTTAIPISRIAQQCSFDNLQHLANAFKRQYGTTMTAFRRAKGLIDMVSLI